MSRPPRCDQKYLPVTSGICFEMLGGRGHPLCVSGGLPEADLRDVSSVFPKNHKSISDTSSHPSETQGGHGQPPRVSEHLQYRKILGVMPGPIWTNLWIWIWYPWEVRNGPPRTLRSDCLLWFLTKSLAAQSYLAPMQHGQLELARLEVSLREGTWVPLFWQKPQLAQQVYSDRGGQNSQHNSKRSHVGISSLGRGKGYCMCGCLLLAPKLPPPQLSLTRYTFILKFSIAPYPRFLGIRYLNHGMYLDRPRFCQRRILNVTLNVEWAVTFLRTFFPVSQEHLKFLGHSCCSAGGTQIQSAIPN